MRSALRRQCARQHRFARQWARGAALRRRQRPPWHPVGGTLATGTKQWTSAAANVGGPEPLSFLTLSPLALYPLALSPLAQPGIPRAVSFSFEPYHAPRSACSCRRRRRLSSLLGTVQSLPLPQSLRPDPLPSISFHCPPPPLPCIEERPASPHVFSAVCLTTATTPGARIAALLAPPPHLTPSSARVDLVVSRASPHHSDMAASARPDARRAAPVPSASLIPPTPRRGLRVCFDPSLRSLQRCRPRATSPLAAFPRVSARVLPA